MGGGGGIVNLTQLTMFSSLLIVTLLSLLINCKGLRLLPEIKNNSVLFNTVKVLQDIMKFAGRRGFLSSLTPLIGNRDFLPGIQKSLFHRWHWKGIRVVGDLYLDNTLRTFNKLKDKFNLE